VTPSVARDTMRLMAFSDGVFAITITLLALEIKPSARLHEPDLAQRPPSRRTRAWRRRTRVVVAADPIQPALYPDALLVARHRRRPDESQ
jgi:hypothetical protein